MRLGIMQPYFFPYLGYISLIKHTDEFILFDTVQFIRHGWIERNRILKQNEGWLYIKASLEAHGQDTLIKDIRIDNSQPWKQKILSQLQSYKRIAPYYHTVNGLVQDVLGREYADVVALNKATLLAVCSYLGIERKVAIFSQMGVDIEPTTAPDEWALNICKALGAVEYWNPPGGQTFFDKQKYTKAGIDLKFQDVHLSEYDQKRTPFEPDLSILDVMMFNNIESMHEMLDDYELI